MPGILKGRTKRYFLYIWNIKKDDQLSVVDRLFFFFLMILEYLYRAVFWGWRSLSKSFITPKKLPSHVISIGNLSVGGTGKTVFVNFLANLLSQRNVAIITRGYGGSLSGTKHSFIINDGAQLLFSVDQTGDEAYMLAQQLKIPVAVGRNRFISYKILVNKTGIPAIILLDDAYQNRHIKKDCDIVLIDARKPLENNHCLPAGLLREKDYTRADYIILTHTDCIDPAMIPVIKKKYFPLFDATKILAGKHVTQTIHNATGSIVVHEELAGHRFLCFAGIGSFSGFLVTVGNNNLTLGYIHEFADHHAYTNADIDNLCALAQKNNCSALITTEKDWVKIVPLIKKKSSFSLPLYVLTVTFEFLSSQEYSFFVDGLNRKI